VVDRQEFNGSPRPPEIWETGFKDTVIAYPGEITRVKAKFDLPGRYVWHCHIVEHEDNEMMRPYRVGG
jgi:bilirubin oxidase